MLVSAPQAAAIPCYPHHGGSGRIGVKPRLEQKLRWEKKELKLKTATVYHLLLGTRARQATNRYFLRLCYCPCSTRDGSQTLRGLAICPGSQVMPLTRNSDLGLSDHEPTFLPAHGDNGNCFLKPRCSPPWGCGGGRGGWGGGLRKGLGRVTGRPGSRVVVVMGRSSCGAHLVRAC